MAIAQVTAGNRILISDLNAYYNLLKGVSGSGEAVTLIYNDTGVLILQPSSNPAAGTEFIQIKNAAGTVLGAFSSDGKTYAGDGTASLPGMTFELDKDTGLYRSAANTLDATAGGTRIATFDTNGLTMQSKRFLMAKGADVASATTPTFGTDGNYFHITGTTTITTLPTLQAGTILWLEFDGACQVTHNGTSLILKGATNFTSAAGDVLGFISEGSGNWRELTRRLAAADAAAGTTLKRTRAQQDATFTTTSGTMTDITSYSITITPASSTNTIKVSFSAGIDSSSVSASAQIQLVEGSTAFVLRVVNTAGVAGMWPNAFFAQDFRTNVATSATTYKAQAQISGGNTFSVYSVTAGYKGANIMTEENS